MNRELLIDLLKVIIVSFGFQQLKSENPEPTMIKHIVMWKLHDQANGRLKAENAAAFKRQLEQLPAVIPEIQSLEVGIGYKSADGSIFDMVLTTSHAGKDELQSYAVHPEHQKVLSFAGSIVAERRVVDYEG